MKKNVLLALSMTAILGSNIVQAADVSETDAATYNVVTSAETTKVILDSDMRYLTDDMYTLMVLLQADAAGYIDLLGVTTANPGVRVETEAQMALDMLEKVGRTDIPVYIGTNTPLDGMWYADNELVSKWNMRVRDSMKASLDPYSEVDYSSMNLGGKYDPTVAENTTLKPQNDAAWKFMIEQVQEYPGQVVILSIGAATNTAIAIENDPTFAENTAGIYYMGGQTPLDGSYGYGSFNWASDAKAVNVCLNADFPKQVLIPSEIAETTVLTKDVMDQIVSGDSEVSKFLKDIAYSTWEEDPDRTQSFWDVVVPAVLMLDNVTETEEVRYMTLCEEVGPFLGVLRQWKEEKAPKDLHPVQVVWSVDNDIYWDFLVDLLTSTF